MATALTRNLTAQGTASYSTTQKKFGTASMAGTGAFSGYIADICPFGPSLSTIECWFYATAVPAAAENLVVVGDSGNVHNFYIQVTTAGGVSCTFKDSGNTTRTLAYATSICDSTWHHLALVLNATSVVLYVDGTSQATNANTPFTGTSNNIAIGSNTAHSTSFLQTNSYVDEAAFWNINKYTANFTPNTSAYTGSEANLIHLYHLDSNLNDSNSPKVVFLTSGTSYATPSDWTGYNATEAIGAGGDGSATWGGGGGAYAVAFNQSLSGTINYRVGTANGANGAGNVAANSWFNTTSILVAAGADPASAATGAGGTTANSVGTNLFAGGAGYNAAGGAAGPNGAGGSRTSADGVAAAPGGAGNNGAAGGGAAGSAAGGAGGNGTYWTSNPGGAQAGPGGGGGFSGSGVNGNGGNYGGGGASNSAGGTIGHGVGGLIVITYIPSQAGTAYSLPGGAVSASYGISDHNLIAGFGLGLSSGSYSFSPTNMTAGFGLAESSAAYAYTPSTAGLQVNGAHPYNLVITPAGYTLFLNMHTLTGRLGIQCPAQSGSFALTDSLLTSGFGLAETSAVYAVSRHVAGFVFNRVIPETPVAYGFNPNQISGALTWNIAPASYSLVRNTALFNTSITKDILIQTIPYFIDVPVIYLVNDLNVIINYINQSILYYAFSQSNLIKPFIMIPPDELNEALNLLVRAFNGVLDLLSWGQSYHLRYFSGVSASELTLAVNTLIDEINGFTVSH